MARTKFNTRCYHLNLWRQTREGDCYQWLKVGNEEEGEGYLIPVDDLLVTPTIPANSCELGEYSLLDLLPADPLNSNPNAKKWNRELVIELDGVYHVFYRRWDHLLIIPSDHPDVFDTPHWEDDLVRGGEGVSPKADIREWQRNQRKMKEWFGDDWNGR